MKALLSSLALAFAAVTLSFSAQAKTADPRIAAAAEARDAYWRAIDAEDYATSYGLFTTGMRAMLTPDQHRQLSIQSRSENGAALERRVMRTTIYDNPPNAPGRVSTSRSISSRVSSARTGVAGTSFCIKARRDNRSW